MRATALLALALSALAAAGCAAPATEPGDFEGTPSGAGAAPSPTPVEQLATPPGSRAWPDLGQATVRPGVGLQELASAAPGGDSCTAGFVFTDQLGRLYLGAAAHCFDEAGTEGAGRCAARAMPAGTEVRIEGASQPGRLAYSSTEAMARLGTQEEDACQANDFALVEVDAADAGRVHPAVLGVGGPVAVAAAVDDGLTVLTVGASPYRPGPEWLDHAEGPVERTRAGGWLHTVGFTPQRIPGDSGSPVVAEDGSAVGLVGTLGVDGASGADNGVVDLRRALDFARRATGLDLRLATWERLAG